MFVLLLLIELTACVCVFTCLWLHLWFGRLVCACSVFVILGNDYIICAVLVTVYYCIVLYCSYGTSCCTSYLTSFMFCDSQSVIGQLVSCAVINQLVVVS